MVCSQRLPKISKFKPPPLLLWCKDTFICPSTAWEGAWTLYIIIKWKSNPVWNYSWAQPPHTCVVCTHQCLPKISNFYIPPLLLWCKDTFICPSTAWEGAESLYFYIRWKSNPVWSESWAQPCHSFVVCTQWLPKISNFYPPPLLLWRKNTFTCPSTAWEGA